ncbi:MULTISPECIES: enoyl-CoA hydratase-related protein [unclassified Nocardioides]|uniref:enoyl-CoA hydratase-related protein n=1 Tax=unclassified Nocardioides TaxID=2615069 RepID=UPI000A540798|nr:MULTISPECIES: enoyl-CoA hydratase-related protein [unclassified Nocardioides]
MTEIAVRTIRHDRTLIIGLDRPAKRNAINAAVTRGLDEALNLLEDDDDLWCGILAGGPTVFSAGADLVEGPGAPTERGGIAGIMSRVRPKPLIAAVEGVALGGGFELVLCCDLVVASRTASFGFPEVKRGLLPDFGGVFRAPRVLPANVARELLLTAEPLGAERAERLGFVNRLVEPGMVLDVALGLASTITGNAPLAVRESLALAHAEINGDESEDWAASHAALDRLLVSADVREGIDAFFERRDPVWRGR